LKQRIRNSFDKRLSKKVGIEVFCSERLDFIRLELLWIGRLNSEHGALDAKPSAVVVEYSLVVEGPNPFKHERLEVTLALGEKSGVVQVVTHVVKCLHYFCVVLALFLLIYL